MVASDTLLVAYLVTIFALRYLRYVIDEDQVPVVHANLTHLSLILAFLEENKRLMNSL